jgi:hypothetical protein
MKPMDRRNQMKSQARKDLLSTPRSVVGVEDDMFVRIASEEAGSATVSVCEGKAANHNPSVQVGQLIALNQYSLHPNTVEIAKVFCRAKYVERAAKAFIAAESPETAMALKEALDRHIDVYEIRFKNTSSIPVWKKLNGELVKEG